MTTKLQETATYYEVLGVSQNVSFEEIKQRYKALTLKFHPDRERSSLAGEAMVLINKAYEILSDPIMRDAYDRLLWQISEQKARNSRPQARVIRFLAKIYSKGGFPLVFAITLSILCLAGYGLGPMLTDQKSVSDQFMKVNHSYFAAILQGAIPSLPLCVPVFGAAWAMIAGFVGGIGDRAVIGTISALPPKVAGTALCYFIVAAVLKLVAYYTGMCRSVALVNMIRERRFTKLDIWFTTGEIELSIVFPAIAGCIEYEMVHLI